MARAGFALRMTSRMLGRWFSRGRRGPLSVGVLLTYRCNLSCRYCRLDSLAGSEMSTGDILGILGQFREMGALRIGLSGGEPLLREDLGEIVAACRSWGMAVSVNTNGVLLSERIGTQLKDVDQLAVSLDGPPDLHDGNRGPGTFARLEEGVRAARRAGKRVFAITVITSANLPRLPETLQTALRLGMNTFLQPVTACDVSGLLPEGLMPETAAFRRELLPIIRRPRQYGVASSPAFLRHLLRYPHFDGGIRCRAGEAFVYVSPDGTLTPCHTWFLSERPSALTLGVAGALTRLQRPDCRGCAISPYMELSLIANRNLSSLCHAVSMF